MPSLKSPLSFLLLLVLISLVPRLLLAQYTTATLSGIITDSSGRTVPEARLTIQNTGTGLVRAFTTGEDGAYLFPALPVGTYRLQVEKEGFSPYSQEGITLDVNQTATQSVSLHVGRVEEQIKVFANAQMLPAETSNIAQLVDTQRIVDLPLNGRQAQSAFPRSGHHQHHALLLRLVLPRRRLPQCAVGQYQRRWSRQY